mmetsp:Transcript_6202/g.9530  ORF Transcript_6202/g.9530 Transcript_6202/m.9530 type:complete len:93 (-) Transcript_6202:407-685(-)
MPRILSQNYVDRKRKSGILRRKSSTTASVPSIGNGVIDLRVKYNMKTSRDQSVIEVRRGSFERGDRSPTKGQNMKRCISSDWGQYVDVTGFE